MQGRPREKRPTTRESGSRFGWLLRGRWFPGGVLVSEVWANPLRVEIDLVCLGSRRAISSPGGWNVFK